MSHLHARTMRAAPFGSVPRLIHSQKFVVMQPHAVPHNAELATVNQRYTKRALMSALLLGAVQLRDVACPQHSVAMDAVDTEEIERLEDIAFEAYANRDFQETVNALTSIIRQQPYAPRWYEMRAQVLVDGKSFNNALSDFAAAINLTPEADLASRARLAAGRALAYEGLSDWRTALADYDIALALASDAGESPNPFWINSRGNCFNSLGLWAEARENYLISSQLFQQAKGFRGRNGSTTARLDGAIFAASNAALMLVELGDEDGAIKEMEKIARRAPGSADMRAALAALYWHKGKRTAAEDEWEYTCNRITVGCAHYKDADWLLTVRRWPPVMLSRMQDFLQLSIPAAA